MNRKGHHQNTNPSPCVWISGYNMDVCVLGFSWITPPPTTLCVNQSLWLYSVTHPLEHTPHAIHDILKSLTTELVVKIQPRGRGSNIPPCIFPGVSLHRWADVNRCLRHVASYYPTTTYCLSFTWASHTEKNSNLHGEYDRLHVWLPANKRVLFSGWK